MPSRRQMTKPGTRRKSGAILAKCARHSSRPTVFGRSYRTCCCLRGRSERASSTLQEPPAEGAEADWDCADRWLSETWMAQHNKQFAIGAEREGLAFVTA